MMELLVKVQELADREIMEDLIAHLLVLILLVVEEGLGLLELMVVEIQAEQAEQVQQIQLLDHL